MRPGIAQLFVVLAILLLFFGARRLPELAGSLGRSMRELRKAAADEDVPTTPEAQQAR